MKIIYCSAESARGIWSPGDVMGIAMGEDGVVLNRHLSSSLGFSKIDLGLESDRGHAEYDAHFGAGNWRLEWVDDPGSHAGWQTALLRNKLLRHRAMLEACVEKAEGAVTDAIVKVWLTNDPVKKHEALWRLCGQLSDLERFRPAGGFED